MPCPRCGLQNPTGTTSCGRCGLALTQGPPGQSGGPAQGSGADQGRGQQAPDQGRGQQASPYRQPDTPRPGGQGGPAHQAPERYAGPSQPAPAPGYAGPPVGQPVWQMGGNSPQPPQSMYGGSSATDDQTTVIRRSQEQQRHGYPGQGPPPQYGGPGAGPGPAYGGGQQAAYQGGNATPSAAWPMTTPNSKVSAGSDGGALSAVLALGLGGLLALCYAAWAFTARRGVFADFADGNTVSSDDAKSSDSIDTLFVIVAGLVALVALGFWIVRLVGKKSKGGGLDIAGITVAGLGVVVVLVGLFLASGIADADGQTAQGDKGVIATLVIGCGFVLLAVGLLLGIMTVRGPRAESSTPQAGGYPQQGYGTW